MEDVRKDIRFITRDYKTIFTVKDGDSVKFTSGYDGEVQTLKCRHIDETHLTLIGKYHNDYHIDELAGIAKRNGHKYEAIPGQKPKLNILAAKYGDTLQNTEIPMTEAAIKRLVGGKYDVTPLLYPSGKVAAALVTGKDGFAVCGITNDTLTTLHPYTAQMYKRELNLSERPAKDVPEKKPSLDAKLEDAKAKVAAQNASKSRGGNTKKRDTSERS